VCLYIVYGDHPERVLSSVIYVQAEYITTREEAVLKKLTWVEEKENFGRV